MHICHICVSYSSQVSICIPACGRYIWKISKLALISVKILVTCWQFAGYNRNFNFCPTCQSNLFLVAWFVLAIWEILPLALFCAAIYGWLCC